MSVMHRMQGFCFMFTDYFFKVKPVERSSEDQASLDRESRKMQLYFCKLCPKSIKVKRRCEELGLRVVVKDVLRINAYKNELLKGGGELKVPCLRIEGQNGDDSNWMYNGEDILEYLDRRFSS